MPPLSYNSSTQGSTHHSGRLILPPKGIDVLVDTPYSVGSALIPFVTTRSHLTSQGVTHPGIALVQARLTSEFSWDPKPEVPQEIDIIPLPRRNGRIADARAQPERTTNTQVSEPVQVPEPTQILEPAQHVDKVETEAIVEVVCPLRIVLDRVVLTSTGVFLGCWQVISGTVLSVCHELTREDKGSIIRRQCGKEEQKLKTLCNLFETLAIT
ncbi:hypothetical protein LguiA_004931 [Lonicera macranthoides]